MSITPWVSLAYLKVLTNYSFALYLVTWWHKTLLPPQTSRMHLVTTYVYSML